MKTFIRFLLAGCFAASLALPARAGSIWNEGDLGQGDAGSFTGGANITTGLGSLTEILGSLTQVDTSADMYEIDISDPTDFSAITVDSGKNFMTNPAIYLFSATGQGLFGNDNDGVDAQASIPLGTTASLAPGIYYIMVTASGVIPENKNGDPIFGDLTNTTTVAAGSSTPLRLTQYGESLLSPAPDDANKKYDILLTGADFAAQTPEPATVAFTALGLAAVALRRRAAAR